MFLSSTMHGLSNIFNAENMFYKIYWTIIFVTAIIGFLILMNKNLSNYYKHEVVTNIETFRADSLDFPSVTLCIIDFDSKTSKFFN